MCKYKILMFLITISMLSAADWPKFMGPDGNGISKETGLNKNWNTKKPVILWKIPMSDQGYAGPSTAKGKVFIINHKDSQDIVTAIDINNGKIIWSFKYSSPTAGEYGQARTTPTYDNGNLYTLSKLGKLYCLNAETGEEKWALNITSKYGGPLPKWQIAVSPFIDGEKLILCPGGQKNTIALNKNTGKLIWQGGNNDPIGYATPIKINIKGQEQYVVFSGYALLGLDTANGNVLWKSTWRTTYDVNASIPLFIAPDKFFITSGYNTGCAMIKIINKNANQVWKNKTISAHFSSPILYNKYIYANSDPGYLICLDPVSGTAKWKQMGFGKGGFIIADGCIIALGGSSGDLFLVKINSDKYQELGKIRPLGGQSWTAPILTDGKLIIRNKEFLACLDLK